MKNAALMSQFHSDAMRTLREGLTIADGNLRRAERRVAWADGLGRAASFLAAAAGLVAVEVVATRLIGMRSMAVAWCTACLGVIAAGAVTAMAIASRREFTLDDVAERLDLSASSQNVIATALDLCREPDTSLLASCAVADGLRAVHMLAAIEPPATAALPQSRRSLTYLTGGILAVGLSLFVPTRPGARPDPLTRGATNALRVPSETPAERLLHAVPLPKRQVVAEMPVDTPTGSLGSAGSSMPYAGSSDDKSASADSASAGESSVSKAKSGEPAASSPESHQASLGSSEAVFSNRPENSNTILTMAAAGMPSADSARSQGASESGGDEKSDPSRASTGKNDKGGNGQQNKSGNGKLGKSRPGEGGGEGESKAPKKESQDAKPGHSTASGNQAGGQGQSDGQNATKKSRGVAPLLLSTLQPDVLQSPQLPGPDERTEGQIPPRANPSALQPAVPAAARPGSESAVDVYLVPGAARRAVQQYFEQLHQDPATPAAVP